MKLSFLVQRNNTIYIYLSLVLSCITYYYFGYFLERTDSLPLLASYTVLFLSFIYLTKNKTIRFKDLALISILFRIIFIISIPNLSQDFYRFIWDGRLFLEGYNPYLHTPDSFINNGIFPISEAKELHTGMGELSAKHFTNYPPLNQFCFIVSNLFSNSILGSVVGMRLLIIFADVGVLYFGKKLLESLKLNKNLIFLYILNPFIIIEFTGNLHFEGVMLCFLIWALYYFQQKKWLLSALLIACSISVKLIPLMLLPLFLYGFKSKNRIPNFKKLISFYGIIGLVIIATFIPFITSEFINNYSKTIGLWFGNFEFNASIYYILREIGYLITGYNEIGKITKVLPLIAVFIILCFSFQNKNSEIKTLISSMVLAFTCYLFLSTTVHPWYISTLILLSIFTKFKFPLVWSFIIIISYLAYNNADYKENLWIITLEYVVVFSAFIYELFILKKLKSTYLIDTQKLEAQQ